RGVPLPARRAHGARAARRGPRARATPRVVGSARGRRRVRVRHALNPAPTTTGRPEPWPPEPGAARRRRRRTCRGTVAEAGGRRRREGTGAVVARCRGAVVGGHGVGRLRACTSPRRAPTLP